MLFGVFINLDLICLSTAVGFGKAGPVQAIENLKIVWQVLAGAFIFGEIPNLVQIIGCAMGFGGLCLIVIMR